MIPRPTIKLKQKSQFPLIDLREQVHGQPTNLNSQITTYLAKAVKHIKAESTRDDLDPQKRKNIGFRIRSIEKAIEIISNHDEQITSGAQAQKLKGIGKGIAGRIDEILQTGRLAEIDNIEDQYVRLVQELTNISGIGLVKAKQLIKEYQISSLDDLIDKYQKNVIKLGKNQLTQHQVVGLRYARDLDQKIPRTEIDQIKPILIDTIKLVNPNLTVEICGSYRRGKAISGDIDVLVSHPEYLTREEIEDQEFLTQIVAKLTEKALIIDHLTEAGQTKYMGICRLNSASTARRIDIRVLPWQSYPTALLYFTGSGNFNQLFRSIALQRGYTISEYAICPLVDGLKGDPIRVTSEFEIFNIIGVKFLTPQEREF